MKYAGILVMLPFLALGIGACGGENDNGGGGAGGGGGGGAGGGGAVTCSGTSLTASEASNYAFASTLTFPPVTVAAKTELTLDWGGVTKSFLGHTLDTKQDLDTILVMLWKLPLSTLEQKLNADTLLMRDLVTLPLQFATDGSGTSAKLFQFSNTGLPTQDQILGFLDPDAYPSANYTYTLMVATGDKLGEGTRMIQSFHLDKSVTETTVKVTSSSTNLTWEAHLQNAKPTGVPAGQAAIKLDWTAMKTNALGNPWSPVDATNKVLIGHYNETVAELEKKFLDIELIATELYRTEILDGATSVDFSTLALTTDSNKKFSGINSSGTWLVALQCGSCKNPAPWYLSVLKPCQ